MDFASLNIEARIWVTRFDTAPFVGDPTFGGRTDKGVRDERGFTVFIQSGQGTRLAQYAS